jgi:hypothetical protein
VSDFFVGTLMRVVSSRWIQLNNALIQHDILVNNNLKVWKMKILLKSKVFVWYLRRGVILTKDNLAKRNQTGKQKKNILCHKDKTIKHLFFQCSIF